MNYINITNKGGANEEKYCINSTDNIYVCF